MATHSGRGRYWSWIVAAACSSRTVYPCRYLKRAGMLGDCRNRVVLGECRVVMVATALSPEWGRVRPSPWKTLQQELPCRNCGAPATRIRSCFSDRAVTCDLPCGEPIFVLKRPERVLINSAVLEPSGQVIHEDQLESYAQASARTQARIESHGCTLLAQC